MKQLPPVDVLVLLAMKTAAKCDKSCETLGPRTIQMSNAPCASSRGEAFFLERGFYWRCSLLCDRGRGRRAVGVCFLFPSRDG